MAINFPASPSTNDTFTAGSITYKWDGAKWIGLGVTPADRLIEGSNSLEIDANNDLKWIGDQVVVGDFAPVDARNGGGIHIRHSNGVSFKSNSGQSVSRNWRIRGDDWGWGNLDFGVGDSVSDWSDSAADNVLSLTSGRNVGINETEPDNKLHITTTSSSAYSTNTTNTSNLTNALLKLQNLDGSDGTGANNYVGVQFSVANGATSTAQMQYVRTGDNAGKFEFKARNGSTSYPNLLTLKSNNDIGINKPDPASWGGGVPTIEIKGTADTGGNSTRSGAIAFESGSGTNGYAVLWGQEGGIHIYTSATDRASTAYSSKFHSDGNLYFASGKGIDFSANANASGMTSELLNDYEHGTWTPTITNLGDHSTTAASTWGKYSKIGNRVWITWRYSWSGRSTTNGSTPVYLDSLPFTSANDSFGSSVYVGGLEGVVCSNAGRTHYGGYVLPNNNRIIFRVSGENVSENSLQGSNSTSSTNGYIYGGASYIV